MFSFGFHYFGSIPFTYQDIGFRGMNCFKVRKHLRSDSLVPLTVLWLTDFTLSALSLAVKTLILLHDFKKKFAES